MKVVKYFVKGNSSNIENTHMMYGTTVTFFIIFILSLYHFYIGEVTVGLVDLLIALVLLFFRIKLDQPTHTKRLNIILITLFIISLSFAIFIKGADALYWVFPVISAIYFMVSKRVAFVLTLICISITFAIAFPFISKIHILDYYPALLLHSFIQFIWASRTTCQQKNLYNLATKDSLTKVNNRLSFDERIDNEIKRIRRSRVPVSLLMLDLDYFKEVNDKFGHNTGDDVLIIFTKLITDNIRKSDSLYRYGGDEFIIITDNTTVENAAQLAEQLRKKANKAFSLNKYHLTVSIGVTTLSADYDDISSALKRVDDALYEAKKRGRNCVFQKSLIPR